MSTFIKNGSPSLAKRIEKEITSEAVKEDKKVQHALKELHNLEKADKKATKVRLGARNQVWSLIRVGSRELIRQRKRWTRLSTRKTPRSGP